MVVVVVHLHKFEVFSVYRPMLRHYYYNINSTEVQNPRRKMHVLLLAFAYKNGRQPCARKYGNAIAIFETTHRANCVSVTHNLFNDVLPFLLITDNRSLCWKGMK